MTFVLSWFASPPQQNKDIFRISYGEVIRQAGGVDREPGRAQRKGPTGGWGAWCDG